MRKSLSIVAVIAICAPLMWGAVFNVSTVGEFQTALTTAATNGASDTINVAAGTYNVVTTLDFMSSEDYTLAILGAGAATTIFDGGDAHQILTALSNGATASVTIAGMTFRNGASSGPGGGLHIETSYADIVLRDCVFADDSADGLGGGADLVSNTGDLFISECTFSRNKAEGAGGLNAGTQGNSLLTNSVFEENVAIGNETFYGDDGGAHMLYTEGGGSITVIGCSYEANISEDGGAGAFAYSNGTGTTIEIDSNYFHANLAELDGAGCFIRINVSGTVNMFGNHFVENFADSGGGAGVQIHVNDGTINYRGNLHEGDSTSQSGGAALIWLTSGTMNVENNVFSGCYAAVNGGAVSCATETGTANFMRNISFGNKAEGVGGALSAATTSGAINIYNNTSYADTSSEGGAMYAYYDAGSASTSIYNNIFRHDSEPAMSGSGAISVVAQYSDIEGGTGESWFGTGCIDVDPMFEDAAGSDFQITWASFPVEDATKSPCIDTGDPASPNDPDGTRADMGALPFDSGTRVGESIHRATDFEISAWPNPFNAAVGFSVSSSGGDCVIEVCDVLGRKIRTVCEEPLCKGTNNITWDGTDETGQKMPSGVYYYTVKMGDVKRTGRLVLMK